MSMNANLTKGDIMTRRIGHTYDSLTLTYFAQRNKGWHSYRQDRETLKAVERAELLGEIIVDRTTKQFHVKEEGRTT